MTTALEQRGKLFIGHGSDEFVFFRCPPPGFMRWIQRRDAQFQAMLRDCPAIALESGSNLGVGKFAQQGVFLARPVPALGIERADSQFSTTGLNAKKRPSQFPGEDRVRDFPELLQLGQRPAFTATASLLRGHVLVGN